MKKIKEVKEREYDTLRKLIFELMTKDPETEWSIFDSKKKKGWIELWIKQK